MGERRHYHGSGRVVNDLAWAWVKRVSPRVIRSLEIRERQLSEAKLESETKEGKRQNRGLNRA